MMNQDCEGSYSFMVLILEILFSARIIVTCFLTKNKPVCDCFQWFTVAMVASYSYLFHSSSKKIIIKWRLQIVWC